MDIVEELRRNRECGARRLEAEYKADLMALARRFFGNETDAEEVVKGTFAKVVEHIDDYKFAAQQLHSVGSFDTIFQ